MYFTREPVIETIITPKEGYKLHIKKSKVVTHEEYIVDALEIVTLGRQTFYRSLEGGRAFLLPAGDYFVIEHKESRLMLKTPAVIEKGIKIGKGKEEEKTPQIEDSEPKEDKKKKKSRRKKNGKKEITTAEEQKSIAEEVKVTETEESPQVAKPDIQRYYIPPPTQLISETLARYKDLEIPKEKKIIGVQQEEVETEDGLGNHTGEDEQPSITSETLSISQVQEEKEE